VAVIGRGLACYGSRRRSARANDRWDGTTASPDWWRPANGRAASSAHPLLPVAAPPRLTLRRYGNPSLTRKRGHLITTLGSRHFSVVGTPLIVSSYGFSVRGCGACTRAGERASERAKRASAGRVGLSGREDLSRSTRQKSSPFIHPSSQPASQPASQQASQQASKPASQANEASSHPTSQPAEPSIHPSIHPSIERLFSVGERVYPRRRWRRSVEWRTSTIDSLSAESEDSKTPA